MISSIIDRIESFTRSIGHSTAWLLLVMTLVETAVVIFRYGLDAGSIALQESVTYMHASVFLLGAAYALGADAHVRVDIFYRNYSDKKKALINLLGTALFLIPFSIFVIWISLPYVAQAWSIKEASSDSGGIPGVYLLKTLIPIFAGLLLLEAVAQILRAVQQLSVQE